MNKNEKKCDFYLDKQTRIGEKVDWKLGFKQIDIDFHYSDCAINTLIDTDPEKMIKMVKDANAETVMVYAKDHWGNAYHKTKVAHKHPLVKEDLLQRWLDAARENKLQTIVFFSLMWDEYAGKLNPDWLSKNADGTIKRWYGGWRFLSLNSPYRDYIFAHMRELLTNYDIEYLFVDPFNCRLGINVPDYNEYDQKLFKSEYGRRIPEILVGEDKAIYMDFRDRFFARFLKELYGLIRSIRKNIKITHIYGGNTDFDDYLNVEGDPFGQDYYAPSMKAKVYRAYAEGRPLIIVTERFNQYWDFISKTKEQLIWEAATAFSHKASIMIVDQPYIKGDLEPKAYKDMKEIYDKTYIIAQHVFKTTEVLADVGLLYHERDEELILELKDSIGLSPEGQHKRTVYRGYLPEFVGAFKYLTESHIPFDCIVQSQIKEEILNKYKIVVIPNIIHMSEEQIQSISSYVKHGGKIIFTYRSATRDLYTRIHNKDHSLFGLIDIDIEDPYTVRFVSPAIDSEISYIRVNRYNVYFSPKTPFETIGYLVLPSVERTDKCWVSHNEPPGEVTEKPAVVHGKFGKGEYIYFSYLMFTEFLEQDVRGYKTYISNSFQRIYQQEIKVDAPCSVEANFYKSQKGLKIFLTNLTLGRLAGRYDLLTPSPEPYSYPCNIKDMIPVPNVSIKIKGVVREAKDNQGRNLKIGFDNIYSSIILPILEDFDIVTIVL